MRVRQVRGRQDLRVELLVLVEVLPLEALAVDLVDLVELLARLGLERGEGPHGLGGQRAAVDQEEDALADAGLHQPVDLVDQREGLAGAGRHRDEHLALAVGDGLLDRGVGLDLVGPQPRVVVRRARRASGRRASKSRPSSSRRAAGVWKPAIRRERFSGWRTSWNQITSPLVE